MYSAIVPHDLRCEHRVDPLGIGTAKPRFSWKIQDNAFTRGQKQSTYRILVAGSLEGLGANTGDLWDGGVVTSDQSSLIEYNGSDLRPATVYYWKVQVGDKDGAVSAWSPPARFSVGPLTRAEWANAAWIGVASGAGSDDLWFRKTVSLAQVPATALATIGSYGYHELYVNGTKVGEDVLTPNLSNLQKRVLYRTYDIAALLKTGDNCIGIWLGPGWAQLDMENLVTVDFRSAKYPLVIGRLDFLSSTNARSKIVTDATWKGRVSCCRHIGGWGWLDYGGEHYDARQYLANWASPGLDEASWSNASVYSFDRTLSPDMAEPNRVCDAIQARSVTAMGSGKYRIDMERIYTGWIEIPLKGAPGATVTITTTTDDGECQWNQLDRYVLDNAGQGVFRNRFNYRLIERVYVSGITSAPAVSDIKGLRIGNDLRRTGAFDCSNALLRKIYDITLNNFVNLTIDGMTVDCTHRERLGYGGDATTSLEAALMNFDMAAFHTKWAQDWTDVQQSDGWMPHTAPTLGGGGGPGWSGFAVLMPWESYLMSGDRRMLESAYPAMKRWVQYLDANCNTAGLLQANGRMSDAYGFLGDWMTPPAGGDNETQGRFFNNCYYLYITRTMARIADILGISADATAYRTRAERIKTAINAAFYNQASKTYFDTRQLRCAMPLFVETVPDADIATMRKTLDTEIKVRQNGHADVGLQGLYYLTKYLTEADRNDLVFTYANQTTYPGFGYFISKGHTTWPEMWDMSYAGGVSKMHGCYNSLGQWFHKGLAGIRPDPAAPGFKRFIIKPAVVGDVTWARAQYESVYGAVVSDWRLSAGTLVLRVQVPVNTVATVYFPDTNTARILEGSVQASQSAGVQFLRRENGYSVFSVQSGSYAFSNGSPVGTGASRRNVPGAVRVRSHQGKWIVTNPSGAPLRVSVYDLTGRLVVRTGPDSAPRLVVDAGLQPAGRFLVRLDAPGFTVSRMTTMR